MNICSVNRSRFRVFIFLYIALSGYLLIFTPLTSSEANLIYSNDFHISTFLAKLFLNTSHSTILIRVPFFIISMTSVILFNSYLKSYFKKDSDRYFALFLFLVTPGVFVSTIVVSWATMPIFLILVLIISIQKELKVFQISALVLLFFTNTATFVLYLALIVYSYKKTKYMLLAMSTILFTLSTYLETYSVGGIPKGHLVHIFGVYGVTFSPFYSLALIYAIYRVSKDKQTDILWYIATTAFLVSLLFSIRQKVLVTDFAPFIVIGSVLVVQVFKSSVLIRLKEYRSKYYMLCKIVVAVLLLETLLVAFNYPIYRYLGKKLIIIDTSIYTIYDLSKSRNNRCIKKISNHNINLYKFYDIKKCK